MALKSRNWSPWGRGPKSGVLRAIKAGRGSEMGRREGELADLPTGGSAWWLLRQRLFQGSGFPKVGRGGAPSCQVRLRLYLVGT